MSRGLLLVGIVACVIWASLVGVLCSDAGIGLLSFFLLAYGGVGLLGFWAIRLVVHLLVRRRASTRLGWPAWLLEPVVVGVVAGGVLSGAALYARFWASKPFLDLYASSVQASPEGAPHVGPAIVGLFSVRETELLPGGVVRLITTTCGFDDCGLVYSPQGSPPVVGEDRYSALTGGWWKWWRSW